MASEEITTAYVQDLRTPTQELATVYTQETVTTETEDSRDRGSISDVRALDRDSTKLQRAARMVMFTKAFSIVSIILIIVSLTLFIWGAVNHTNSLDFTHALWFDIFNLLVTIFFGIEISMRYCVFRDLFWKSCWNIFDLVLLSLCAIETLMGFVIDVAFVYVGWRLLILAFRYTIQLLRLLCLLRHQGALMRGVSATNDEVNFDTFDEADIKKELARLSFPIPHRLSRVIGKNHESQPDPPTTPLPTVVITISTNKQSP